MALSLSLVATAFALVLPVELPDKTLIATLVLTTRYRPGPVLVGVGAAFAVQCLIAVSFGSVLTLLPERVVALLVCVLFGLGAAVLLYQGFRGEQGTEHLEPPTAVGSWWRTTATAFGVLFAAEWGDASQLATAALTARYHAPLAVGLGAWLALISVAGIAVAVGRAARNKLPAHWLQRVAGVMFSVFAVLAGVHAVTA
jgi:putative Ca2+/H+ antiporter (TMEM165/GDT1 family)